MKRWIRSSSEVNKAIVKKRDDGLFDIYHEDFGFAGCVDKAHVDKAVEIINRDSVKSVENFYRYLYD